MPSIHLGSTYQRFPQPKALPHFKGNQDGDYNEVYGKDGAYGSTPLYETHGQLKELGPADPYLQTLIQKLVPPGAPILELGCNQGNNLLPLASKGYPVYGLDLEQSLLTRLQSNAEKQGIHPDNIRVQRWDFAENGDTPWLQMKGQFKAIYAVHVLSHLRAPQLIKTMQALQEQLAPGGVMICSIIDDDPSKRGGLRYSLNKKFTDKWENSKYAERTGLHTSDVHMGFVHHSQEDVDQAFEGLDLLREYSRPFHKGEKGKWALPEKRLRWVVYQKPQD